MNSAVLELSRRSDEAASDSPIPPQQVLVVAPQPFYQDRGTPIAVRQVLDALVELGHRVDLLTFPVGESPPLTNVRYLRVANLFGIREVPIGLSLRKLVLDAALLPDLYNRMRNGRYACVHAVEEAAFPAVALGRRYGIPVIYDMQSSLPEQLAKHPVLRSRPVQMALRRCEAWLLRNADAVVSSTGLAHRVRTLAPHSAVSEWCFPARMNAVDPRRVTELRRGLRIADGARVIVYTGTFEAYQGLDELLRAVPLVGAGYGDAVFVLVGGNEDESDSLRRQAEVLNVSERVRVLGRQDRERMELYLGMADVLISPRAYGGNIPLKIFDYLAAGRPIVATDIACHRGVLDEERAVLVRPSARGLADGISEILGDPVRAARLGRTARSYAEQNLGWSAFVESIRGIYQSVLGPDGRMEGNG